MKNLYLLLLFSISFTVSAQVTYEEFQSERLGETRELKIQLPRNYDIEEDIEYPLVIVFDGDYLFEPVVGNIDYQAYWNDMPDCIVVGINQAASRDYDFFYGDDTNLPSYEGAKFFEFVGMELIPYIQNLYRASKFRIAIGHDLGANFTNYYLFKDYPIFNAYINLSPDFAPQIVDRLMERLSTINQQTFYYLATSEADIADLRDKIKSADNKLKTLDNEFFNYKFDEFSDSNHYSLVGQGIPKALNFIFSLYKPINAKEFKEEMLTYDGGPMAYLEDKYERIEAFYGFKKKVIENDLRAVAAAAKKNDDYDAMKELSKLAKQEYPDSMISAYYQGVYHEMDGNLKKALNYYQSGLLLIPSQFITKEILLDKIYEIKDEREN